jgi:hypothetical protein
MLAGGAAQHVFSRQFALTPQRGFLKLCYERVEETQDAVRDERLQHATSCSFASTASSQDADDGSDLTVTVTGSRAG